MLNSLRFRLLLTLILVVVVAIGAVALFARYRAADVLIDFAAVRNAREGQAVRVLLQDASQQGDVQQAQARTEELGRAFNVPIVLVDEQGRVVAASDARQVGQMFPLPPPSGAQPVVFLQEQPLFVAMGEAAAAPPEGQPAAWDAVFISGGPAVLPAVPVGELEAPAAGVQFFMGSIDRAFVWAAGVGLVLAAGLSLALSRRIVRPIETLTAAARRMGQGDLDQRVPVESQDEIGELAGAFNAMADGLRSSELLRRQMVSDVAHELRTPLSNIRGYLEAVQDGLAQANPALIHSLHEEAMLLSRLVDDLQELALAEAGQLKLVRQRVALDAILKAAVSAAQPQAAARGLRLAWDPPPGLPWVEADAARIGQVVRNLLSNAITHTPAGGEIVATAEALGAEVEVRVRDTGGGIAPEALPHVFDRFYRADSSRSRATGGAGLGLAIVKQLVEAHGGRVRVDSRPGAGATFAFTLPQAASPN